MYIYSNKKEPTIRFQKYTTRLIASISRKKYNSIVINYTTIDKIKCSNIGKKVNKK